MYKAVLTESQLTDKIMTDNVFPPTYKKKNTDDNDARNHEIGGGFKVQ